MRSAAGIVHELGKRVGQASRADVVNGENRALVTHGAAGVDDLLAAPLHLRVVALHGAEIEVLVGGAGRERRRGASAEADEHRRPADHDERRAGGEARLLYVLGADAAVSTGDHDRLVIAAHLAPRLAGDRDLERAEGARDAPAAELIVERGAADGPPEHDVESRPGT